MVDQALVNYIRQNLNAGYNINVIKSTLVSQGYRAKIVDEAINFIYKPQEVKHVIHVSPTAIIAIVIILISLGAITTGIIYLTSNGSTPKQLLDVNIKAIETNVYPGDIFKFNVELFNLGNLKRYDITLKYEIKDTLTDSLLTTKTETVAIETGKSLTAEINIPPNAKIGNYMLETVAAYKGKRATSSIMIRVVQKEPDPTCTDGIKNQDEEDIDCGGPCEPCATCEDEIQNQGETGIDCGGPCEDCLECEDNNVCTEDLIVDGACEFKELIPCCGNQVCEANEDVHECPADCTSKDMYDDMTIWEKLEVIKEISKNDPQTADVACQEIEEVEYQDQCFANIGGESGNKRFCEKIAEDRIKDKCFADVAKKNQDSSICTEISQPSRADSCYMNFVMDFKEYELCDKIANKYLKDSCFLLKSS